MRYLSVVDHWFDDVPGGMARVAADHARLMAETGADVTVACIGEGGADVVDGVEIHRIPAPYSGVRRLISFARGLRHRFGGSDWDVVHVHSAPVGLAAISVLGRSPRFVFTVHSPISAEMSINWAGPGLAKKARRSLGLPLLSRVERFVLARSDCVHVLSEFTSDLLWQRHGETDVRVIPHYLTDPVASRSADPEDVTTLRRHLGWPTDRPVVFTVRGHKPRVGLEDLIHAAEPLVANGDCLLVIAGAGPLTPRLVEHAASLGLGEGVLFPGRISDSDLDRAYRAADVFVLPSRDLECFGLVTIEALARGLPVIGSDAGATPEILTPLDPGLIYEAGNVPALRQRLVEFLQGDLNSDLRREAAGYARAHFSSKVVTPQLLAVFAKSIH